MEVILFFESDLFVNPKPNKTSQTFLCLTDRRELNIFLVPSVQCVPYLIAMGTDPEPSMRNKADQQLVEIDKKYTGFIHVSQCPVFIWTITIWCLYILLDDLNWSSHLYLEKEFQLLYLRSSLQHLWFKISRSICFLSVFNNKGCRSV